LIVEGLGDGRFKVNSTGLDREKACTAGDVERPEVRGTVGRTVAEPEPHDTVPSGSVEDHFPSESVIV